MESVFHGLYWKTLLLSLDDIIVIASGFNTHMDELEEVQKRLRTAELKFKPTKCEPLQKNVKYRGHFVGQKERLLTQERSKLFGTGRFRRE